MRDIFSGERVLSGSQSTVARSVRPELNNNNNFKMSVMNDQEAWGAWVSTLIVRIGVEVGGLMPKMDIV